MITETIDEVTTPIKDEVQKFTYGQKAVGLGFNPSGDVVVQKIKELYAQVIDLMDELRNCEAANFHPEHKRLARIAITEAQAAQMRAVKAITWRD